ncbi:MAG TPA: helix-turn-helix domain-containing protein, partial [Candidatus Goldiibacteriota bacterium]|nr:helix-turn-helix domain-containing protein [Candidatus Goldiibacteriota bacterium]
WPGNIRELKNAVEEAAVVTDGELIPPESLNMAYYAAAENKAQASPGLDMPLHELEKKSIILALTKTKGNQTRAAKLLGITRKMIMNKIEKYDLSNIVPIRTRRLKKDQ